MALNLERLERRDTPAFTSALSGTTAELLGDGAADTFGITAVGGVLQHNRAGDPGFASATDWNTAVAGTQTLAADAASAVLFLDLGGGDDTVFLGGAGANAFNIRAAIGIVTGGGGTDRLVVSNLASTGMTYDVSNVGIQSTGVNVTTLTPMDGGTIISTGSGNDNFNVASTSAALTLDDSGGSGDVNLGQPGQITGVVRVFNDGGPTGRTRIRVDDTATVGGGGLIDFDDEGTDTVLRRGAIPFVRFNADWVENLIYTAGSGPDQFLYRATRGVPTALFGGAGDDFFQVNVPAGATGEVSLVGEGGNDNTVVQQLPAAFVVTANGNLTTGVDFLSVGTPAGATATITHETATNGTVRPSAGATPIAFRDVRLVTVFGAPADLIVNLPAGVSHSLTLGQDGGAADPDGLDGGGDSILTGPTIPATQFDAPSVGLTINLGDAGSTIAMLPMDPLFAPTGNGLQAGGTLLRGGAAADRFSVNPDADSVTRVDGGGPTTAPGDTLGVAREYPNPAAAPPSGTLGSGPGSLTFTGIEDLSLSFADDLLVAGSDRGGAEVAVFDPDPTDRGRATPFPGFAGGVRVAMADFNGDGEPDVVVGTGPGGPTRVRVLDGNDLDNGTVRELFTIDPFEAAFTGGVYVAAGDITGDGVPELVITPDEGGGPRVRVFNGAGFAPLADFLGIDDANFRGGARPAVGDMNGDGFAELVVAAGFGGGPRVAVFKGSADFSAAAPKLFGDFFVFEQGLRNGTFVAVGDVNGDGFGDLVAGGGPGGGPRVLALSGADLVAGKADQAAVLANFFAGDVNSRGGVRVATAYLDNDAKMDLVTGAGQNSGSRVTAYLGSALGSGTPPAFLDLDPFPGFTGGAFVG